jgi:predicted nucleotidyltransferase
MNKKLTAILAELRRRFEALYGARLVQMLLFGSQARGDAEPGSDIDVLVVLRGEVSPCEEIARTEEFFTLAERLIGPLPPPDRGHS